MDLAIILSALFLLVTVIAIRWTQYRLRRNLLAFLAEMLFDERPGSEKNIGSSGRGDRCRPTT
jgi:hypothetical protein